MRPHGRSTVNPAAPEPCAICDRCGFKYNHSDLVWQFDWRGNQLTNLKILVCRDRCLDIPFEFNRPVILPPDPVPIDDPRPGFYAQEEGTTPNTSIRSLIWDG